MSGAADGAGWGEAVMKTLIIDANPSHQQLADMMALCRINRPPPTEYVLTMHEEAVAKAQDQVFDFKKQRGKHHGRNPGAFGKSRLTK